ncbi:putative ribonuclease H protein [Ananas comosus]|uniref:Putative ribonuclease H protein n=1 Tax=Ananas comosus TaxID=4615 RepID=A0A199V9P1_ANACO|nr:putative ribonuclease H protein [Ananas comosus]
MWSLFEWASGMKINREKSELYYMGQIEGRAARLANLLECKVGTLPTTYLGFPLSPRRPTKAVWTEIIHKIEHRIEGWQAKLLSRGGRLILVNAVLTTLPLYFLFVFKAPKWVIKRIEALRRDFFWNGGVVNTGVLFHWGISHSLGNGNSIDFWTDRWCGDTCLHLAFPEIYALTEHNLIKRLLTADNLAKRGWSGDTTCMLCMSHDETVNHLLAQCVFTKFILVMDVENIQATEIGDDGSLLVEYDLASNKEIDGRKANHLPQAERNHPKRKEKNRQERNISTAKKPLSDHGH